LSSCFIVKEVGKESKKLIHDGVATHAVERGVMGEEEKAIFGGGMIHRDNEKEGLLDFIVGELHFLANIDSCSDQVDGLVDGDYAFHPCSDLIRIRSRAIGEQGIVVLILFIGTDKSWYVKPKDRPSLSTSS
jgi:hypothetical protein